MSAAHKITARGYPITTRANITTRRLPLLPSMSALVEAAKLDAAIAANLKELGYGG